VLEQGFIPAPAWQLQKAKDEQVIRRILNFGNQELTGTRNSGNVIETHEHKGEKLFVEPAV
jgi:hypothetical protein